MNQFDNPTLTHSDQKPRVNLKQVENTLPNLSPDRVSDLLEYGQIGHVIGEGRQKRAIEVGDAMVFIQYHGKRNEGSLDQLMATQDYWNAQMYMQQILKTLLPNNFPQVYASFSDGLLVERIPDTQDLQKAREINEKYLSLGKTPPSPEEEAWFGNKTRSTEQNEEFEIAIALLSAIGIIGDRDHGKYELALPVNTTFRNGHPVLLEMMNPLVETGDLVKPFKPRIDTEKLMSAVRVALDKEFISQTQAEEVEELAKQYLVYAEQASYSSVNAVIKEFS